MNGHWRIYRQLIVATTKNKNCCFNSNNIFLNKNKVYTKPPFLAISYRVKEPSAKTPNQASSQDPNNNNNNNNYGQKQQAQTANQPVTSEIFVFSFAANFCNMISMIGRRFNVVLAVCTGRVNGNDSFPSQL